MFQWMKNWYDEEKEEEMEETAGPALQGVRPLSLVEKGWVLCGENTRLSVGNGANWCPTASGLSLNGHPLAPLAVSIAWGTGQGMEGPESHWAPLLFTFRRRPIAAGRVLVLVETNKGPRGTGGRHR